MHSKKKQVDVKIDQLTAEIEKQKKLLAKYRQTILQEAIEGKLTKGWREGNRDIKPASELLKHIAAEKAELVKQKKIRRQNPPSEIKPDEIPFEIPKTWQWCRLGDILTFTDSGWSPACPPKSATENSWGVLKTTAIQKLFFDQTKNKGLPATLTPRPEYEVKAGELLITRAGPANRVGICCCIETTRSKLMLSDKIIRLHPIDMMESKYIAVFFTSPGGSEVLTSKKKGMAQSQVNVSQNNLKTSSFPLPPRAEQQEIVRRVETKFALCDKLEAQINSSSHTAETLSAAILQELFDQNGGEN